MTAEWPLIFDDQRCPENTKYLSQKQKKFGLFYSTTSRFWDTSTNSIYILLLIQGCRKSEMHQMNDPEDLMVKNLVYTKYLPPKDQIFVCSTLGPADFKIQWPQNDLKNVIGLSAFWKAFPLTQWRDDFIFDKSALPGRRGGGGARYIEKLDAQLHGLMDLAVVAPKSCSTTKTGASRLSVSRTNDFRHSVLLLVHMFKVQGSLWPWVTFGVTELQVMHINPLYLRRE